MAENHYLHVCSETAMHSLHGLVDLAHRRLLSDAGSYDRCWAAGSSATSQPQAKDQP
jgi:hypothetical protein